MNEEPQGVAPEIAPGHNPDRLIVAQVGEGWRLLEEDEITGRHPICAEAWINGKWDAGGVPGRTWHANSWQLTYRTRLSREDLRAARGLEPEPAPEPLCVCGHEKREHRDPFDGPTMCSKCHCRDFRPAQPAQGEAKCSKCGGELFHDCGPIGDKSYMLCFQCDLTDEQRAGFGRSHPAPAQAISAEVELDWTEDFGHENGSYLNCCPTCRHRFQGHKRRMFCKSCSTPTSVKEQLAHAAQEVSRVERERESARSGFLQATEDRERMRHMRDVARNFEHQARCARDELAQVRETLAQEQAKTKQLRTDLSIETAYSREADLSLARVEGERDDMQRARDLEQQSVGNLITQVSALTAERDALRAQVENVFHAGWFSRHGRGSSFDATRDAQIDFEKFEQALSALQPKGQE